jgi:hypothetical protein
MLFFVTKYFQIALDTGPDCDPDQRDSVDISKEKETLRKFISKKFLKVDPEPSIEESCIYTVHISVLFQSELFVLQSTQNTT